MAGSGGWLGDRHIITLFFEHGREWSRILDNVNIYIGCARTTKRLDQLVSAASCHARSEETEIPSASLSP